MISGLKTFTDGGLRRARWMLVSLLCAAAPAWAFDLGELMGLLAKQKQGEATFTEQRYVRGFDGPLAASGTLSFTAPDQLVRRTLTPRPETMAVDGNNLVLSRSGRTRSMTLDSVPELQGLVEAMRATLAGNSQVLERYFKSTVSGGADAWTLDLAPVDSRLSSQIAVLRLSGKAGEVLGVEMEFRGGDRSVMTIVPKR
ncbi:outer membrane lipoprotein carrier protein LolA [Variovorax ginsengisoli]|uniref:Outer membrane lipoprotein carrier protein LolA n=1 Tax=Variovorax guangxiensis TaxID=1775474 RepID=A0A502E2J3_9BURK|nr:outer membrane lipoprotein carrier protein LolA [Variovorax ginsengisoli]TPG30640.1 outer membrane lipoprotein carrier protein LolA [Variovorax guangxiensis]